jgi:trimethylamine---corrinoid protein Co-methyltransferase
MGDMDVAATGGRRVRGGGGSARRAERTAVSLETAKYIQRNIPNFEILNEEALQIIEWNADTVLEEIGVNFVENPGALRLWKEAGADVQGERVRIPRGLARKLCATAPSSFTQHTPATRNAMLSDGRSKASCWPRSTARPSCATSRAGGAMPRSRISRIS